jgi:hypothetical protein
MRRTLLALALAGALLSGSIAASNPAEARCWGCRGLGVGIAAGVLGAVAYGLTTRPYYGYGYGYGPGYGYAPAYGYAYPRYRYASVGGWQGRRHWHGHRGHMRHFH